MVVKENSDTDTWSREPVLIEKVVPYLLYVPHAVRCKSSNAFLDNLGS